MSKISRILSIIVCLFMVACQASNPVVYLSKTIDAPPPSTAPPPTILVADNNTTPLSDAVTPPHSPALYAIIAADTRDRNIGNSVKNDIQNMEKALQDIVSHTQLPLVKHIIEGDNLSYQQVTQTVKQLPIQPDDVVIFYYSGHGARSSDKATLWPFLCVEGARQCIYDNKRLDLDWVVTTLKEQKKPRLFIALADACNNVIQFRPPTPTPVVKKDRDAFNNGFIRLFVKSQGHIIASGSITGEISYGTELGGYFTNAWIKALYENVADPTPADWYNIMNQATQPLFVPGDKPQQPQAETRVSVDDGNIKKLSEEVSKTMVTDNPLPPPLPPTPPPPPALLPATLTITPPSPLPAGKLIQVHVHSAINGNLSLYEYDADHTLQQIFPKENFRVMANRQLTIPDPQSSFELITSDVSGQRWLIALIAEPQPLTQLQSLLPQAISQVVTTQTSATAVTQALIQWFQGPGKMTGVQWSVGVVGDEVK